MTLSAEAKIQRCVELTGIISENGEQCLITLVDITERKQAEDELKQTRQNFETFFNTVDDFLFVLDVDGIVIHANETVFNRLGLAREDLLGKSVITVHPPEKHDEADRIVAEILNGKTLFYPGPIITKQGIKIPVEKRFLMRSGTANLLFLQFRPIFQKSNYRKKNFQNYFTSILPLVV